MAKDKLDKAIEQAAEKIYLSILSASMDITMEVHRKIENILVDIIQSRRELRNDAKKTNPKES
jgi:hypothetical protein